MRSTPTAETSAGGLRLKPTARRSVLSVVCMASLVVAALLATYATAALAANPTKGATYVADSPGGATRGEMKISMRVASSGKSATVKVYCGSATVPQNAPRFAITGGRFRVVKKSGPSLILWTLSGHFVSSTKATATLNMVRTCDGKRRTMTFLKK